MGLIHHHHHHHIGLQVKSERDVLARRSQLLMMDAVSDEKIMALLFEVEQLQRSLSQERQEYAENIKDLQVSVLKWFGFSIFQHKINNRYPA